MAESLVQFSVATLMKQRSKEKNKTGINVTTTRNLVYVKSRKCNGETVWKGIPCPVPSRLRIALGNRNLSFCECVLCNPTRLKVSIPHQSELHGSPGAHTAQGYLKVFCVLTTSTRFPSKEGKGLTAQNLLLMSLPSIMARHFSSLCPPQLYEFRGLVRKAPQLTYMP